MLELVLSQTDVLGSDADLVVLLCTDRDLEASHLLSTLDGRLDGRIKHAAADERFRARLGQTLIVYSHDRIPARRVALVGLGPAGEASPRTLRLAAGTAARLASNVGATRALLTWSGPDTDRPDARFDPGADAAVEAAAEGALLGTYRFDKYLTDERGRPSALAALLLQPPGNTGGATTSIARAHTTARAIARARDLVNEPAGFMTPTQIARVARDWADASDMTIEVLDRAACSQLGMGLFLAVARGSTEEPQFIHCAWKPPSANKRVILVGKGVTFDSGGLSLKTNEGMLDMKTDMAGAAAVLAAIAAVAEEKLAVEVHALAACTENMPSGSSYKLGDVIRSLDGKTVEINNTDAEGRLTLADALSYGLRLQPDAVLDFATLTGACMVALGPNIAGLMSNDDALASAFLAAAESAGEEMWRLPLPPRLGEQLKSDIADLKNTGERWGGALTAGLFLKEFVGGVPWVHVDIAGPSSATKEQGHVTKGGTGFGVASVLAYLRRVASVP
jgi:leucyl aminopeptidase